MSTLDGVDTPATVLLAGFWSRIGAFAFDTFVLAVAAGAVVWFTLPQVVAMGPAGRWAGLVVALVYFGLFNSRLSGGQTPGKMLVRIRVVGPDGQPVSVPRAFARQAVLCVPFYMNGAWLPGIVQRWMPLSMLAALVVFGGLFAIYYLYLFNRRSRQSLHDLAVRTWVVVEEPEDGVPATSPMWRGHWIPVGVAALVALAAPWWLHSSVQAQPIRELTSTAKALAAEPEVLTAQVMTRTHWQGGQAHIRQLVAVVHVAERDDVNAAVARRLADRVLASYRGAASFPSRVVEMRWGFDVGLVGWSHHHVFDFSRAAEPFTNATATVALPAASVPAAR